MNVLIKYLAGVKLVHVFYMCRTIIAIYIYTYKIIGSTALIPIANSVNKTLRESHTNTHTHTDSQ